VSLRESVEAFDLEEAGRLRRKFDANVNVCAVEEGLLRVRTYERGVEDETLACGTGMAACFLRAREEGAAPEAMTVVPTGGERLTLAVKGETLTLTGAVRHTFDAHIENLKL
jgi:diaminopimelate epimerase